MTTTTDETLAEERRELLEVTRVLLSEQSGEEHLRARLEAGQAHDAALWARLCDTGLVGALVPDELGGAGLTPAHLGGVLHAFGEYAVAEPYLETAVLAAPVLATVAATDGEAAREAGQWLDRVVSGQALAAVDVEIPGVQSPFVAFAADADLLLTVRIDGAVLLHAADDLEVQPVEVLDPLRPLARVVPRGEGTLLTTDPGRAARVRALAVAGSACLQAGAARRLLSLTVDYVGIRHQFGRPVGSFQGVKHKVANVAVKVDMAEAAALSAFEVADQAGVAGLTSGDVDRRARSAKAYAGEAAELANVEALQLHGGIGFTWEYQLHIWLKRAMSLTASHGTPVEHRRVLAAELLAQVRTGTAGAGR
ncbi:acyl-CoA dehydrogenase family protein [Nocardioides campestrisoli]|uniref:acyl-CoA dehydrogenase family protein n=1 Tax=Nocardioides campestrisoli TaxID=2736757 RepID=UPI00163DCC53|nr:acyl-CoA dehydrogenase family protein [Nocardioides campestrisoli]